jgi:hypothetical protein
MRSPVRVTALALVCLGVAVTAHAQEDTDPSSAARFRFGALRFTPTLVLSNIGVDNNVFNETADPKQDTTAAVGPSVNLWLKMGSSRLSGKASGQYLYFNKYDNQRSWNTLDEGSSRVRDRLARPPEGAARRVRQHGPPLGEDRPAVLRAARLDEVRPERSLPRRPDLAGARSPHRRRGSAPAHAAHAAHHVRHPR